MVSINVKNSQVAVDKKGVVTVNSPELMSQLIYSNEETLSGLKDMGINLTDITVSSSGKLQITNKALAAKLKEQLGNPGGTAAWNAVCGNVKCLGKPGFGESVMKR